MEILARIFCFSHSVFKRPLIHGSQMSGLYGKVIIHVRKYTRINPGKLVQTFCFLNVENLLVAKGFGKGQRACNAQAYLDNPFPNKP